MFSLGKHVILPIILIAFLVALWHYRYAMYFFFRQKLHKQYEVSLTQEMRIYDVLTRHDSHLYGIDVSHYQGVINWDKAVKIQDSFPISFVFVRATAGKNLVDRTFHANWKELDEKGIIKGAYHYYRPDENSLQQADNFIKAVRLKKGDLPPVLDIENVPQSQSVEKFKNRVEKMVTQGRISLWSKAIFCIQEKIFTIGIFTMIFQNTLYGLLIIIFSWKIYSQIGISGSLLIRQCFRDVKKL